MIAMETLREVLVDNRKLVEGKRIFQREIKLPAIPRGVLVGIRRSGKSYLLYTEMQRRLKEGQTWDDMLYLNFEDERLLGFDVADFNKILEAHAELSGRAAYPALFLDEIQIIENWERFARRIADAEAEIYVTGSNAKMLSIDVAATLGGRFMNIQVFPLSFAEVLQVTAVPFDPSSLASTTGRAFVKQAFSQYLQNGGFPECFQLREPQEYLNNLYQKIYLNDVAVRNGITNILPLRVMFKKIADSIGQPLSFTRIANILTSVGHRLSTPTVINYVSYACDACLLLPVENYYGKLRDRESQKKYYFADNGLVSLLRSDAKADLLENLVAVALLRKHGLQNAVFYFKHQVEVDFYLPGSETAIQVCLHLTKAPETMKRELGAFAKLSKFLPVKRRIVITLEEESRIDTDCGVVEVMPAWRWLLT